MLSKALCGKLISLTFSAVWSAFYDFAKHKNILARYLHRGMGSMKTNNFSEMRRKLHFCVCALDSIFALKMQFHGQQRTFTKSAKSRREQWPMNSPKDKNCLRKHPFGMFEQRLFFAKFFSSSLCNGSFKNQLLDHDHLGASRIFGKQTSWDARTFTKHNHEVILRLMPSITRREKIKNLAFH